MTKKAFTLIELLIVVAIIAILAAIAVPNFLEAQTRSKVARVKADQRSLATAIESYTVDWNRAPGHDNVTAFFVQPLEKLSTPIAYMSNAYIVDPFGNVDVSAMNPPGLDRAVYQYISWSWMLSVLGDFATMMGLGGSKQDVVLAINALCPTCGLTVEDLNRLGQKRWVLTSPGPVRQYFIQACLSAGGLSISCTAESAVVQGRNEGLYDPTNGTVSVGEIRRDGEGIPNS